MTATATAPTTPPEPPMDNAPQPASAGPDPSRPAAAGPDPLPAAQGSGRRRRDGALTNTILAVLGAAFVAVLTFALTTTNARITSLESKVDAGFERVGDKIDTKFDELDTKIDELDDKIDTKFDELDTKIDELDDKIDTKFDELDDKIDNLDVKLTALIAALNRTAEVEAALDGSLLDRDDG